MNMGTTGKAQPEQGARKRQPVRWSLFAALTLLAAIALLTYAAAGSRIAVPLSFLTCAAVAAVLLGIAGLLSNSQSKQQADDSPHTNLHADLVESAGPAILSMNMDGQLTYLNPAAECLLGYHASELAGQQSIADLLTPDEKERLVEEIYRNCDLVLRTDNSLEQRLAICLQAIGSLPPSKIPGFNLRLRSKGGASISVTLYLSSLRDGMGACIGLVGVAVEQSIGIRQEQAQRESQEHYRDHFENSAEMIATLSLEGQFLYANPAWKRTFAMPHSALMTMKSFTEVFAASCRTESANLFQRALQGASIDRAPLRHRTADGRVIELELSLSMSQNADSPSTVRCLLRDVTQQKQRENRLALQLVISQIVGENSSADVAATRILEALCISHEWDLALYWAVDPSGQRLEFRTAWGASDGPVEALIQESTGQSLTGGADLPVRAWKEGRPAWAAHLNSTPDSPRTELALRQKMISGWAVPVRAGNRILAVLEFYSRAIQPQDPEAVAAIETAAASLGQLTARSEEQDRAEQLYRQQETLLNSVADGICGLDREGRVSFVNPAAALLLGSEPVRLIGQDIHELLHGNASGSRRCDEDCGLLAIFRRQKAATGEDTIFRADGAHFPAEYSLTPIHDQGRAAGSVLSFHDISQRFALDRMKDEFISTVSHELRTPLTSIRGALGLLSSGMLGDIPEKASSLLRIALSNSDRLVRLINDILDLERIQSGREPLVFRPVQLAEIVRQAIDGMTPVAEAAGVQLIHDAVQVEICADADKLLQVLTNLLSNAVKFSPANSSVSIMLRPGVTGVTVSVIDHGRGIPADKLETIFGRFQQVDASDSRQKGGSGLGLAICRTIVLQHSGRIWAERNPVRGSTFRVFLPYQPSPVEAANEPFEPVQGEGTLVLAGSDPESRKEIADQLKRHGYNVEEAGSLEQTVAAARPGVAAILLDTTLDGMNGWEILPMLRRYGPASRIPVVLLSVQNALQPGELPEGAEGWVANPHQEDTLLGELARVLCGPGEKARVLVVEDDHDLAQVIAEVFTRESISVHVTHTLQDTIDACFTFGPHLLVLDIALPDGDGFNVVDWLRQHESLARLPLVIYSGREVTQAERRQLTLGPTHFLTKARVQPQQLEALVLTMLRNSRQMEDPSTSQSKSSPL